MAFSSQRAARIRKRSRTSAAGLVQRCRAERAGRGERGAGSGVCHQHPRRGLRPRAARSPGLPSRSRPQAAPRPALPGAPRSSSSRAPRRPAAALTPRRRCLPKPSRVWAARSQFRFSLWTPPSAAAARPPPAHVLAGSGITGAGRLPRESSRQAPRGGLGSHRRHLRLVTSRRLHPHLGFPCR